MAAYIIYRIVTLLYFLVVAATIIVVILEKRQPVKTMAWTLVLIALPVLGLVLFFFFGQDVKKERRFQRREINLMKRKALSRFLPTDTAEVPERYSRLASFFTLSTYAPPFNMHEMELFTSGEDKMIALLRDISRAVDHINIEYFIIEDDPVGRLLRDFLLDAVKRGVKVRLMYDDVGCWSVKNRFFREMEEGGITVSNFMPVRFARLTRRVNYRNHRKIAVIDGTVGYIGGMNIAQRYLYGSNGEGWHDMHLRLTGNAVYGLQQTFVADWYYNSGEFLEDCNFYPKIDREPSCRGTLQIVSASPSSEQPYIMNGFIWAILNARRYFYLATPYLMPTEQVLCALQMAASSGVDVRIMVPQGSEHYWIKVANESYYGDLLRAGVRIFAYGPAFLHSKYFVSDDFLSTVGSTNTDFRSFEEDFEVNAFIYDEDFSLEMKRYFEHDMWSCSEIEAARWHRRRFVQKAAESFVRILSPLL